MLRQLFKNHSNIKRQIAPRSAPWRSQSSGLLRLLASRELKLPREEPFWDPLNIESMKTIVLASIDGHFDPRTIVSGRLFWKKHQHFMKHRCENRRLLMARRFVWRYTFRLYTFAIFEKKKNWKINAKRDPTNLVFWSESGPWAPKYRFIL